MYQSVPSIIPQLNKFQRHVCPWVGRMKHSCTTLKPPVMTQNKRPKCQFAYNWVNEWESIKGEIMCEYSQFLNQVMKLTLTLTASWICYKRQLTFQPSHKWNGSVYWCFKSRTCFFNEVQTVNLSKSNNHISELHTTYLWIENVRGTANVTLRDKA